MWYRDRVLTFYEVSQVTLKEFLAKRTKNQRDSGWVKHKIKCDPKPIDSGFMNLRL